MGYGGHALMKSPSTAGVPNLSLTMYPFSISTDERVPLNFSSFYIQGASQLLKQSDWAQIQDFK